MSPEMPDPQYFRIPWRYFVDVCQLVQAYCRWMTDGLSSTTHATHSTADKVVISPHAIQEGGYLVV